MGDYMYTDSTARGCLYIIAFSVLATGIGILAGGSQFGSIYAGVDANPAKDFKALGDVCNITEVGHEEWEVESVDHSATSGAAGAHSTSSVACTDVYTYHFINTARKTGGGLYRSREEVVYRGSGLCKDLDREPSRLQAGQMVPCWKPAGTTQGGVKLSVPEECESCKTERALHSIWDLRSDHYLVYVDCMEECSTMARQAYNCGNNAPCMKIFDPADDLANALAVGENDANTGTVLVAIGAVTMFLSLLCFVRIFMKANAISKAEINQADKERSKKKADVEMA